MKSDIATETDEWRRPHSHHKDTALWCRGHVGIRHQPTVVRVTGPYRQECGLRPSYKDPAGEVWHCAHMVKCQECGKMLEPLPSDDCPDRPE